MFSIFPFLSSSLEAWSIHLRLLSQPMLPPLKHHHLHRIHQWQDDPLFLHHEENPGAALITQSLGGGENYPAWTRSVRKSLIVKKKLGFINGSLTLSSPLVSTPSTIQAWIRSNNMVRTLIINSVSPKIQASIDNIQRYNIRDLEWP